MRITEALIYRNLTSSLSNLQSDYQELNQQAASGKRLLRPSDDPVAASAAVRVRAKLAALDQQQRNIEFSQSWLQQTDSALSSAGDVISRARQLAVQMGNATASAAQRKSAAEEVNNLLEQMVALANTSNEGRYVFAGFREDAPAYATTEAGGQITAVTYMGDSGHRELKLGPNSRLQSSITGQEAFQGSTDVFGALISLRDALEANDPNAAMATVQDLKNAGDNFSAMNADVGAKLNRCDLRLNVISDSKVSSTDSLSQLEDADMVQVIMYLQSKEVIYQAALKAAAATQQLSLTAYM